MQLTSKENQSHTNYEATMQELDSTASELAELKSAFSFCCPNARVHSKFACLRTAELLQAAKDGRTSTVELLLDAGVPANPTCQQQETALHAAAAHNQASTVELLLQFKPNRANPYLCNRAGNTAMHVAAAAGHTSVVQAFLQAGIHPDLTNTQSRSVLALAAAAGHADTAQLLLQHGADPNMQDPRGITALQLAAANGHSSVVQVLLGMGATVDTANSRGRTALHEAATGSSDGHATAIRILREHHAQSSVMDSEGNIPLLLALSAGNLGAVEALLPIPVPKFGSSVSHTAKVRAAMNQVGSDSVTLLHRAITAKRARLAQLLVVAGACVHSADALGRTPLHLAAATPGCKDVLQVLVAAGAAVSHPDLELRTPLHLAVTVSHTCAVTKLLRVGAAVNAADFIGLTPLHVAAQKGDVGLMEQLLSARADINTAAQSGCTPLHTAVNAGQVGAVRLLIAHKADLNAALKGGSTALHFAASTGNAQIVQMLLAAGAGQTANELGEAPLCIAARRGHLEAAKCLASTATVQDLVQSAVAAADVQGNMQRAITQELLSAAGVQDAAATETELAKVVNNTRQAAVSVGVMLDMWKQADAIVQNVQQQKAGMQHLVVGMAAQHKQQQQEKLAASAKRQQEQEQLHGERQELVAAWAKLREEQKRLHEQQWRLSEQQHSLMQQQRHVGQKWAEIEQLQQQMHQNQPKGQRQGKRHRVGN